MADRIPQSVAMRVPLKAYLATDHVSSATTETIAVVISKNGAAFGNPSVGATNAVEIGSGWYYVDLSATDVGTLGPLIVRGTSAGVDDVEIAYQVVDANSLGAAYLDTAVSSRNATTPPTVVQIRTEMDSNSTKLDATVSSRSTYAGTDTPGTTTLLGRLPGTVQPQTGDSFARLGAPAGASISADIAAIKTDTGGLTPARAAKLDNLDATVSSRSTYTGTDTPGTATLLARIPGTVQPQSGDSFSRLGGPAGASVSADIAAIKADTGGMRGDYTPARAAKLDNLDATVSSRSTYAGTDTPGTVTLLSRLTAGRATALDFLDAPITGIPATVWAAGSRTLTSFGTLVVDTTTAIWAAASRTLTSFSFGVLATNVLTAQETADAVWDEPTAGHTTPGSTGAALTSTGSGGGTAGDPVDIAQTLLKLDWNTVTGEAPRSMLSALRSLRNRVFIIDNGNGTGTITVTKEDDAAVAWTATCTFDSNAHPISGVDPA